MVPDGKSKALQHFYYGQKKIRKLHNYLSVPNHSRKKMCCIASQPLKKISCNKRKSNSALFHSHENMIFFTKQKQQKTMKPYY
jgi:hypothetical protein